MFLLVLELPYGTTLFLISEALRRMKTLNQLADDLNIGID